MTYQSIRESLYHAELPALVAITVPHGADATDFLAAFPEIEADQDLQACWPLFQTYLNIERDVGSAEIAHSLAAVLASQHKIPSLVVEICYPRGIIDGGRLLDHCLRPCLPTRLLTRFREEFLAIHQQSLDSISRLYQRLNAQPRSCLIDVHTMASFCPANGKGERSTIPVSFPRLQDYVEQFLNAREHAYHRRLDLLTEDEHGTALADPQLLARLREELEAKSYAYALNEPYFAHSAFLSHQHLKHSKAISIDVPKHMIASWREDLTDYELDAVTLDPTRIEALAACLGKAVAKALGMP